MNCLSNKVLVTRTISSINDTAIMVNLSSIDIEGIRSAFVLYFFFMKDILNIKNTNKSI